MGAIVHIGTSGWSYRHWRGAFYPSDLAPSGWLSYYSEHFDAVEINTTFYRLPSDELVRRWAAAVPRGFAFTAKGSRSITHVRRLVSTEYETHRFLDRMAPLGSALSVVLWQLPPSLGPDLGRLDRFLSALPTPPRHAIEFRDPAWLVPDTLELLRERGAALVCADSDRMPAVRAATTDIVYLRFHGRASLKGRYDEGSLLEWARFAAMSAQEGRTVYAFFNNDFNAYAPKDAVLFRDLVNEERNRLGEAGAGPSDV